MMALPFKPESAQTSREGTLDGRHNKSFNRRSEYDSFIIRFCDAGVDVFGRAGLILDLDAFVNLT